MNFPKKFCLRKLEMVIRREIKICSIASMLRIVGVKDYNHLSVFIDRSSDSGVSKSADSRPLPFVHIYLFFNNQAKSRAFMDRANK